VKVGSHLSYKPTGKRLSLTMHLPGSGYVSQSIRTYFSQSRKKYSYPQKIPIIFICQAKRTALPPSWERYSGIESSSFYFEVKGIICPIIK
jgi:hypothetical protein